MHVFLLFYFGPQIAARISTKLLKLSQSCQFHICTLHVTVYTQAWSGLNNQLASLGPLLSWLVQNYGESCV